MNDNFTLYIFSLRNAADVSFLVPEYIADHVVLEQH